MTAMKAPALRAKIAEAVEGWRPATLHEPVSSRSTSRAKSSGEKVTYWNKNRRKKPEKFAEGM
jgi:hypothetical protein